MALADYYNKVQAYFVASLGRPASSAELAQYAGALEANNGNVWKAGLVTYIQAQPDFSSDVATVYKNLTGAEPTMAIYNYYTGKMLAGEIKAKGLANAMINDLGFMPKADGTYGAPANWAVNLAADAGATDLTGVQNKITVANTFTSSLDSVAEATSYATAAGKESAKALLAGVTADADTVTTATANVDTTVANIVTEATTTSAVGQTFTLTTSADTPAGTSGNDLFNSTVTYVAAGTKDTTTTLTAGDIITGGSGTDTLNIAVSGADIAAASDLVTPTMSGVEKVFVSTSNLDATGTGFKVDLVLADSAITTVGTTASTTAGKLVTFDNVGTLANVNMAGKGNLTVNYATAAKAGTADAITLTASGVGTSATSTATFTTAGVETLNIVSSSGTNYITDASNATTVNVSGSSAATVVANGAATVVNASTATGNLTIDVAGATLGASGVTVTGGTGTDTFATSTTLTAATDLAKVTGFEVVKLTGTGNNSLDAAVTGVSTYDMTTSTDQVLTFATGYTGDTTVKLTGDSTNADKVVNTANIALTVVANDADVDAATTITGGTGTDVITMTAAGGAADLTAVSGVETITVAANATTPASTISITTANATVAATKTMTVNASALTNTSATLTFDGSLEADGYFNVTGGAAADTIKGGDSADTIDGGAGNDSIVAGAGNDSLNGGAGNDTINMAGNLTSADTINGGDGTDTLTVSATVAASAFANVTNVETVAITGATSVSLSSAVGSGATIDLTASTDQVLTFATGYTGATTVKLTGDSTNADKVVNTANIELTVVANDADIDAATTITGGTGTDVITMTASSGAADLTAVTGVETITVAANATTPASTISITTADATVASTKTLAVNASALTSTSATLTFNGSAETNGNFNVTGGAAADTITGGSGNDIVDGGAGNDSIVAGAGNDSLNGGDGNDTINMSTNMTFDDTVAGGSGTDTLIIASTGGTFGNAGELSHVTGIESLAFTGLSEAVNAGSSFIGFSSFDLTNAGDTALTLAAGYTAASGVTVTLTGDSTNADSVINSANVTLSVVANGADVDAATTITGGTGTDTITLKADGATSTITAVSGVETITVSAGTTVTDDIVITMGANNTQIASTKTLTVDATALTDSGATLTFNGHASETDGKLYITGGAGADTISGAGGADTLIGGSGADVLDGNAGLDVYTGGAGADTFTIDAPSSKFAMDTITDLTLSDDDVINFADFGTETFTTAAITLVTGAGLSDYINQAASDTGAGTAGNGIISWFQYGTDTYVVEDKSDAATFVDGTDIIVKITGLVDLSAATVGDHTLTV